MQDPTLPALTAWDNFYVIVGSSAAALTGLQFVVIALVNETRATGSLAEIDAFGTPQVVHFSAVLLVSAILSAPWRTIEAVATAIGVCGVAGVVYSLIVVRRARRQTGYQPVLEDWIFHGWLPTASYLVLALAAFVLPRDPAPDLFVVSAATLTLLFVAIHNAWDTVTYIAITRVQTENDKDSPARHA